MAKKKQVIEVPEKELEMESKYKAKKSSPFSDKDADLIGNFLDHHFQGKPFTKEQVLDLARPANSPIHKYFDWDDTKAAEKYRLLQAGRMIRCVVWNIPNNPNDEIQKITSISLTLQDGTHKRTCVETKDLQSIPNAVDQVLAEAIQNLKGWERRFKMFKNHAKLKQLFTIIESL